MSTSPHTIGPEQRLERAHAMMREFMIRHLPVLHGGELVGIVSLHDLHLIESLKGVDPAEITVDDAMSQEVYSVLPDTPLDEVAGMMAERKLGSAVVMQNNKVVGILTSVDLARALKELLHTRLAK